MECHLKDTPLENYITEINSKCQKEEGMINEPTNLRKEIVRINKLMEPTGKQYQHNLHTKKNTTGKEHKNVYSWDSASAT